MSKQDSGGRSMMQMVQLLQRDNGVAEVLQQPMFAQGDDDTASVSQAEIIADLVNLMRLDVKKMADHHGVDITITRLKPEQAAILVQDLIQGDSLRLVEVFNEIESQREAVLEELLDDEEYQQHIDTKEASLFSNKDRDPDPIDPEARELIENKADVKPGDVAEDPSEQDTDVDDEE